MMTKDEEALEMARIHYEVEPGLTHVFQIERVGSTTLEPENSLILLEVNECSVPAKIRPIPFGADEQDGFNHPLVVAEVTPEEFQEIEAGTLKLPEGWIWETRKFIPKSSVNGAAHPQFHTSVAS